MSNSIGENIKTIRKQKAIKQKDLASSIGLTVNGLQKIEYGETIPKISTIRKIASTLQVSPYELNPDFDNFFCEYVPKTLSDYSTEELLEEIGRRCSK